MTLLNKPRKGRINGKNEIIIKVSSVHGCVCVCFHEREASYYELAYTCQKTLRKKLKTWHFGQAKWTGTQGYRERCWVEK